MTVTHAPAIVACADGHAGWAGDASGNTWDSRYVSPSPGRLPRLYARTCCSASCTLPDGLVKRRSSNPAYGVAPDDMSVWWISAAITSGRARRATSHFWVNTAL